MESKPIDFGAHYDELAEMMEHSSKHAAVAESIADAMRKIAELVECYSENSYARKTLYLALQSLNSAADYNKGTFDMIGIHSEV